MSLAVRVVLLLLVTIPAISQAEHARISYATVIEHVQPRMVKVFGSGGLRNLESYQSGFLISPDGHILTSWSYVLDAGQATIVLDDGRKFTAEILGTDPRSEIAVLKISESQLPFFNLGEVRRLAPGSRVLAFGNLYGVATGDEPASVLHGVVSGVTKLSARRGSFKTPFQGDVYVLDAMTNNAGAAGGALTDSRGNLAAVLGKELRDAQTNVWLNYAIPIGEIHQAVKAMVAGTQVDPNARPSRLPDEYANIESLGIVLTPNVLRITPPFVDGVRPNSAAERAGLQLDDLIVLVNGQTIASQNHLSEKLREIDAVDPVRLTVLRDTELIEFELESL